MGGTPAGLQGGWYVAMARTSGSALPPRLRTTPRLPRGPEKLHPPVQKTGGPGPPPPGFVGATNSATEWMVYWALAKIFGRPDDPRRPPFDGAWPDWTYQKGIGNAPGRSIIDFIIYRTTRRGRPVAIRVQTEYFHQFTSNQKQAYDRMQAIAVSGYADVVDIFDQTFVNDKTGQAVIIVVKNALGLLRTPDPIVAGTALRGSRMDNGGR